MAKCSTLDLKSCRTDKPTIRSKLTQLIRLIKLCNVTARLRFGMCVSCVTDFKFCPVITLIEFSKGERKNKEFLSGFATSSWY